MIPLIAGWGKDAKEIAYLGINKCPNCRNYDHFHLFEVSKKVSAFFVPVAKWGRQYYAVCNVCEAAQEISEDDKRRLLQESALLPSAEVAAEIWAALAATIQQSVEDASNVEAELTKTVARLEEEYSKSHVECLCGVFGEYLEDDDQPE